MAPQFLEQTSFAPIKAIVVCNLPDMLLMCQCIYVQWGGMQTSHSTASEHTQGMILSQYVQFLRPTGVQQCMATPRSWGPHFSFDPHKLMFPPNFCIPSHVYICVQMCILIEEQSPTLPSGWSWPVFASVGSYTHLRCNHLLYPIRICTSFPDGWIDAMKLLHTEIKTFTKIKCMCTHTHTSFGNPLRRSW